MKKKSFFTLFQYFQNDILTPYNNNGHYSIADQQNMCVCTVYYIQILQYNVIFYTY